MRKNGELCGDKARGHQDAGRQEHGDDRAHVRPHYQLRGKVLVIAHLAGHGCTGYGSRGTEEGDQGREYLHAKVHDPAPGGQQHCDAATVGEALIEEGLIKGHDTEYGLYVDEVNGIALDQDKDGKYWAFYINGEHAQTGVDTTDVEAGAVYTFKPE